MSGTLRVEGLSNIILGSDIRALCAPHGKVLTATIIPDPVTGLGSGAAVVEMETELDAINVRAALDGSLSHGRALTVGMAKDPVPEMLTHPGDLGETAGRSGRGSPSGFGRSRA